MTALSLITVYFMAIASGCMIAWFIIRHRLTRARIKSLNTGDKVHVTARTEATYLKPTGCNKHLIRINAVVVEVDAGEIKACN